MTFDELSLDPRILRVLHAQGMEHPTPVQEKAIPVILEGKDVVAIAQTGTGKTFAYILPSLSRLAQGKIERNLMLVLTPTRELAQQVQDVTKDFGKALKIRSSAIYGGASMPKQIDALTRGCPVVIATPGRLLDHLNRKTIQFPNLVTLVLDEADRMLDMGFLPDIRRILRQLPDERQTIMCSATWPDEIARLTGEMMENPEHISVGQVAKPVEKVRQVLYPIYPEDKMQVLLDLLDKEHIESGLVFLRTKDRTERIYKTLRRKGFDVAVIHGDRSQGQRQQALEAFRAGKAQFLVATDVAARGLDVEGISHVINYDIPQNSDDYIHRIGRTARAEAEGDAFTFACPQEHEALASIEKAVGRNLPRAEWKRTAPVLSTWHPPEAVGKKKRTLGRKRTLLRRR